ncbi:MAG TPA: chloride channel protein [Bacillota bacterium]|nr:chloride channel protein [Bacillota bacterium]
MFELFAHVTPVDPKKAIERAYVLGRLARWLAIGVVAGLLSAIGIIAFLKLLYTGIGYAQEAGPFWWALLPVGGFISTLLIMKVAPLAFGHGTEAVIRSVNKGNGNIPFIVAPVKAVATVISIASGASLGKEGPSAQIGGAITSTLGRVLKLDKEDQRRITLCGLAAGFSIVSGAPIAGAIFATEALVLGSLNYSYLLPSLVTSVTSVYAARLLDEKFALHIYHPLWDIAKRGELFKGIESFSIQHNLPLLLITVLGAVLIGSAAMLFTKAAEASEGVFHKIKLWAPLKTSLGGVVLILMALVFGREYLGLGMHELCDPALEGELVPYYAFAVKILFVAVSLGCGFSGGAMTPIFVIGSVAGAALGRALGMDIQFAAGIGIVSFLAGAANTPITAAVLGLELFGPTFGIYGAIAAMIAYTVSGHDSINASQIFGGPKICYGETCEWLGHSFEEIHMHNMDIPD